MFLLKFTILCIILLLVPFFLGKLISYKDSAGILSSPVVKYILGHFTALALFWILCTPMALLKIPFSVLVGIYTFLLTIFCGISIWICCREKPLRRLALRWSGLKPAGWERIYLVLFLLLLCVQLYFAIFYESTVYSYDDYEYVVQSLDTITSDHMFLTDVVSGKEVNYTYKRVLNSWNIYIAYLSEISGVHVTTIAHTVIPAVFLVIAYLVYFYIAAQLFNSRENRLLFLCILSVIFIFGLYSSFSLTFRLLVTLWQGKAILATIVVPFLITFLPRAYRQTGQTRIYLYLSVISMTACSLTMTGSGMSIIVYTVMLIVLSFYRRRPTGIKHCLCGCTVPVVQLLFYLIMR